MKFMAGIGSACAYYGGRVDGLAGDILLQDLIPSDEKKSVKRFQQMGPRVMTRSNTSYTQARSHFWVYFTKGKGISSNEALLSC